MSPLLPARSQMALSLGFHMVFAAVGVALPLLMLMAEGMWLRTGKRHYKSLARKWAKATGLLFVVGAVSGTALSFELGLLWPRFMEKAGSIIGPAFALEGFAFFIEAIFLGLYLYGWERLSPWAHWWTGVPVAVSGLLSGVLVVAVNAWMQFPVGFEVNAAGQFTNIDPLATFRSPMWAHMAIHSSLSCYMAVAFALAGVYAYGVLRGRCDEYCRSGLSIAMAVAMITSLLQTVSGDYNGRQVAQYQPVKLAAMEALFRTRAGAPLVVGGIPDVETGEVSFQIEIPYGLSLLATHDPLAVIRGLEEFHRDDWPNVLWVHVAFQIMVGCGTLLIGLGGWYWWVRWRRRDLATCRWLMWATLLGSPMGFIALEAGWFVTELGRQPWTIYRVMRTADAVTPVADVAASLMVFTLLYVGLAVALVMLLLRLGRERSPTDSDDGAISPEQGYVA